MFYAVCRFYAEFHGFCIDSFEVFYLMKAFYFVDDMFFFQTVVTNHFIEDFRIGID